MPIVCKFMITQLNCSFQGYCPKLLFIKSTEAVARRYSVRGVLKNFEKLTGRHLCQILFFNKVAGLRPATLLKKTLAQVFSCEFCEISKNTFS